MTLTASQMIDAPQEMFLELALNLEPPEDVAERYGFDKAAYLALSAQPTFHKTLAAKKTELENLGFTFQAKMGMMAEDLLVDVYRSTINKDVPVSMKLEVAKYLTKIADKEPKGNVQVTPGAGFSISINFNGTPGNPSPAKVAEVIDAEDITPQDVKADDEVLLPSDNMLRVPDFDLTNDLVGPLLDPEHE